VNNSEYGSALLLAYELEVAIEFVQRSVGESSVSGIKWLKILRDKLFKVNSQIRTYLEQTNINSI